MNGRRMLKSKPKPRPPVTHRYCKVCDKKTYFRYDPAVGHSKCCECGFRNIPLVKE